MTQPPIPIESMAEGLRAPEAMRGAIRRALEKSPDARFQTVKEFNEAFGAPMAYAGGRRWRRRRRTSGVSARRSGSPSTPGRSTGRRRASADPPPWGSR